MGERHKPALLPTLPRQLGIWIGRTTASRSVCCAGSNGMEVAGKPEQGKFRPDAYGYFRVSVTALRRHKQLRGGSSALPNHSASNDYCAHNLGSYRAVVMSTALAFALILQIAAKVSLCSPTSWSGDAAAIVLLVPH